MNDMECMYLHTSIYSERCWFWIIAKDNWRNSDIFKYKHTITKDEISAFSRPNGDWMVGEWRLNGDGKGDFFVTFQSPLSDYSDDWMAGTFLWSFSQLKVKSTPNAARTPDVRIRGKVRYSATGNIIAMDEYLVHVKLMFKPYFEVVFLIFYNFYNHQLSLKSVSNNVFFIAYMTLCFYIF